MSICVNLDDAFKSAETINVYNEGVIKSYASNSKNFEEILDCWTDMISNAHIMPALGVSLNHLTTEAIQSRSEERRVGKECL